MNNRSNEDDNNDGFADANTSGKGGKSNKPSSNKFNQQRLAAWQPILTAGSMYPIFILVGLIFIPIGIALLMTSAVVNELVIPYTDCNATDGRGLCKNYLKPPDLPDVGNHSHHVFNSTGNATTTTTTTTTTSAPRLFKGPCKCRLSFTIEHAWSGKVFIYYGLTNYFQNHRRYVKSRDDNQLLGRLDSKPNADCEPFRYTMDQDQNTTVKKAPEPAYAPCGAVANSMFNDSITLLKDNSIVNVTGKGIAWSTDKAKKFRNPGEVDTKCGPYMSDPLCWERAFNGTAKPKDWDKPVYQLDEEDPSNNGFKNEDFIVWMRTAALPNFRKLYRKIVQSGEFEKGLPAGNYTLEIVYNYPVHTFGGTKRVILTTSSWMGSKNPFMGTTYIVVGGTCLALAAVFLVLHMKFGKITAAMENVSAQPDAVVRS